MTYLIIAVAVLAFAEIITLTFIGKRAKKAHTEEVPTPVYSEHFPYEESQIAYNRMHGLPDDAI